MYENNYKDIEEAQKGNKETMTTLVKNNMGLIYNISKRFVSRGYEIEDLNQIGTIGLIKAINNFDTSYNVKLSTYCVPYILGEIKKFIRDDRKDKSIKKFKRTCTKNSCNAKRVFNKIWKRNWNR